MHELEGKLGVLFIYFYKSNTLQRGWWEVQPSTEQS